MKQLAHEMDTHTFEAGDVLVKKEDQLDSLVIIAKGSVVARDVSLGGRTYNDQIFGPEGTPSFDLPAEDEDEDEEDEEDDEYKALNANNTNMQDVDGHSLASSSGSSSSDERRDSYNVDEDGDEGVYEYTKRAVNTVIASEYLVHQSASQM